MYTNHIPKKELKKLTDAITKAILKSKDAKALLLEMYKKDIINSSMMMFLALNIQNIDCIKVEKKKKMISDQSQYIDGRKLTKKEESFYEYCTKNFDEKDWLQTVGIKYT